MLRLINAAQFIWINLKKRDKVGSPKHGSPIAQTLLN